MGRIVRWMLAMAVLVVAGAGMWTRGPLGDVEQARAYETQTIPFSHVTSGEALGLCEGGPLKVIVVTDRQAVVTVTAMAVDNGDSPYPPGTPIAGVSVLGGLIQGEGMKSATKVVEPGTWITVCVDRPAILATGTVEITPFGRLTESVELEGTPVVRDCPGRAQSDRHPCDDQQQIDEFEGSGCGSFHPAGQWKDCEEEPDGVTEKNWPVVVVQGEHPYVEAVWFKRPPGEIQFAQVQGYVTLGDYQFSERFESDAWVEQGDRIGFSGLELDESYPAGIGKYELEIHWNLLITFDGDNSSENGIDPGDSKQTVFVMLDKATTPTGFNGTGVPSDIGTPYVSVLVLATDGANGLADENAIRDQVWSHFTSLTLPRYRLDPESGEITSGANTSPPDEIRFYYDWDDDSFLIRGFPMDRGLQCDTTIRRMLVTGVGRCGQLAALFAAALGQHGMEAQPAGLSFIPEWRPIRSRMPASATFMLIGPAQWQFEANAFDAFSARLRYLHTMRLALQTPPAVTYVEPGSRIAQGTSAPPGLFLMSDHYITTSGGKWYDPSYGEKFDTVADWADGALAGYASFYPFPTTIPRSDPSNWSCIPANCALFAGRYPGSSGPLSNEPRGVVGVGDATGFATSLVLPPASNPVIAYADIDQQELNVATCGNAACTSSGIEVAAELTAPWGAAKTAIGFVGGNPVVVYEDVAPGSTDPPLPGPSTLRVASCGNATCAGPETIVDLPVDPPGGFGAVFDGTGPIIATSNEATGKLFVISCGNASCSTNTVTQLLSFGKVDAPPAIALTPGGLPVLLVHFEGAESLIQYRCTTRTCSSTSSTTVEGIPFGAGGDPHLAITSTGVSVISHISQDGAHVLLTICGNLDCTADPVITTVGSFNPIAFSGSHDVEVAPGDIPVVAYGFDETGDALAVYRCAVPTCSTGGTRFLFGADQAKASDLDLELDPSAFPVVAGWAPHEDGTASFVVRCASLDCGGSAVPAGPGPFELWPITAVAGQDALQVSLEGTNFTPGSVATFRGQALATQFVSATEITATIPASMLETKVSGFVGVEGSGFSQQFTVGRSSADIDCNGRAEADDALLLMQVLVGLASNPGCGTDVNGDETGGLTDVVYLRRQLAGLAPPLESAFP